MRSIKLVPLLTAAAALLAMAPAGASARRASAHAHATRPCHVRLEYPRPPVPNGEAVTINGTLSCPKAISPAGHAVTLLQQSAPKAGFASVAAATTEAGGAFQVVTPALTTNSIFYAVVEGAQSARRTIRVSAPITASPPTPPDGAQLFTAGGHNLRKQNAVTFAGEVSSADAGAPVVLQRENATGPEDWRPIDRSFVDSHGKYAIVHHFQVPGEANIRVLVHPRKINAAAATSPVSYEISQAQNPALTIETSADPTPFDQPVTIKGVVAGAAAKTPVTLLARTAGGGPFAPVASAVTGDKGAYEFAKQTPLKNTAYKVSAASAQSAVLFQGVKYALTVSPTIGTIAAGQPVTFSGAVLPALVGHVVYLERQGALRLGWRVIDVGTVSAPANPTEAAPFTIVHAFRTPGTARLRVKIPGDPGNQGAAGAPFELTVTQTPASALAPEAPGNSRLPSEGQL